MRCTMLFRYNVVGYLKLALVVLGGFLLFDYQLVFLNILGIFMTLGGVRSAFGPDWLFFCF